jgi:hypothetical protein
MTEEENPQNQHRGFASSLENANNAFSTFPLPRLRLLYFSLAAKPKATATTRATPTPKPKGAFLSRFSNSIQAHLSIRKDSYAP